MTHTNLLNQKKPDIKMQGNFPSFAGPDLVAGLPPPQPCITKSHSGAWMVRSDGKVSSNLDELGRVQDPSASQADDEQ